MLTMMGQEVIETSAGIWGARVMKCQDNGQKVLSWHRADGYSLVYVFKDRLHVPRSEPNTQDRMTPEGPMPTSASGSTRTARELLRAPWKQPATQDTSQG